MKSGIIQDKMAVKLVGDMAHYQLDLSGELILMNELVGEQIQIHFTQEIKCSHCGKKTKKSYSGGHCYPCSMKLASCDLCILKPELCHFALGTCREPNWGEQNCMIPHFVYLANTGAIKVGITRHTQIPTRWIDQGASFALPIIKVNTRLQSGLVEQLFASEISDKTDWRKMLKGIPEEIDLEQRRDELFELLGSELDNFLNIEVLEKEKVAAINYPVAQYPEKVSSLSLDKNELIKGKLLGIKGQYLILDTGVINIRNHCSYKIELEY
jgi:hypothetical protein